MIRLNEDYGKYDPEGFEPEEQQHSEFTVSQFFNILKTISTANPLMKIGDNDKSLISCEFEMSEATYVAIQYENILSLSQGNITTSYLIKPDGRLEAEPSSDEYQGDEGLLMLQSVYDEVKFHSPLSFDSTQTNIDAVLGDDSIESLN